LFRRTNPERSRSSRTPRITATRKTGTSSTANVARHPIFDTSNSPSSHLEDTPADFSGNITQGEPGEATTNDFSSSSQGQTQVTRTTPFAAEPSTVAGRLGYQPQPQKAPQVTFHSTAVDIPQQFLDEYFIDPPSSSTPAGSGVRPNSAYISQSLLQATGFGQHQYQTFGCISTQSPNHQLFVDQSNNSTATPNESSCHD
jgi:hypothetical protein